MKIIIKDVELAYEDGVIFDADIEVEIDEKTGEKIIRRAIAKEKVDHPNWNLEPGQWFNPGDSIEIKYLYDPYLDVPLNEVYTASEAEKKWNLKPGTIRSACVRGKLKEFIEKGMVRKSGNTWLVTKKVMDLVYGDIRPTHVYFSNNVGAPGNKITLLQEEIYSKIQEIDDAINYDNARYVHYYYEQLDDYDNTEYVYIATENV